MSIDVSKLYIHQEILSPQLWQKLHVDATLNKFPISFIWLIYVL